MKRIVTFTILLVIVLTTNKSIAQSEWGVIGGLSKSKRLGFSLGGQLTLNPYMGSRHLETIYLEIDKTYNGWGIMPKFGLAFSPHLGLGKGFKSKNKWYGTNPKHYLELSAAPGVFFRKGMGVYIRPEIAYLLSTPFEKFKVRAAYGYDFELKKRDNFESSRGIVSVKFIYILAFKGMFI